MSDSPAKKSADKTGTTEVVQAIVFTCKFCGETKPLSELVIIKNYFPQLSACNVCARGVINHEKTE
jgi:hypothetical protein